MDTEDLDEIGGTIIVVSGFFFFLGDAEKYWPYCLGAALFGLLLIFLSRVLPNRGGDA